MEPIFIYFNKVKFDNSNSKTFTITFSNGDALNGVLFKKTNDYYITSMTSSITIEKDFTELQEYDNIKKISDIANDYLNNGINHFKKSPMLSSSIFYERFNKDLTEDETKQASSTVEVSFIDLKTKNKNTAKVYSRYEKLKIFGLKFSNSNLLYNIDLVTENEQLYLNKKLQLRQSRNYLVRSAIRKTYSDNAILMKYNKEYYALYFPIAKYWINRKKEISKQQFDREILTHRFVYNSFFTDLTSNPSFLITFREDAMSHLFPIFWGRDYIKIYPNTEILFTPFLYEKLKTKMTFGPSITLSDLDSFNFRHKFSFLGTGKKF